MKLSKTALSILLGCLGSLLSSALGAAPEPRTPIMYDVAYAKSLVGQIERGTWRTDVVAQFGSPTECLADGVWLYRYFRPDHEQAVKDGCTTLVVTFNGSTVDIVRLANSPAVALMRKRVASGTTDPAQVAAAERRQSATQVAGK